ncbi:MAG: STAS domain-containing protein [Candidatus Bathyarchaeota archaeon]
MGRVASALRLGDCLLVTPQGDLHDSAADLFLEETLESLNKARCTSLILNMGNVEVVDSFMGRTIGELIQAASLHGVKVVVVGLRPEVAITMVEMNISIGHVDTALNIDNALNILNKKRIRP